MGAYIYTLNLGRPSVLLCCVTDCLYSTLLPQAGRQLELCWRTSWASHPSEDLSELPTQKYHYGLTGSWRDSLPGLSWPEWVSLCTLFGRPMMRNAPHRWSSRTRPDASPSANVFKLPDVTAHGGVFQGSMREDHSLHHTTDISPQKHTHTLQII